MRVVIYGVGMRSPLWRAGAAVAVVLAALAVGGCVGEEPDGTPSPEPTSAPLFASDEEALAAAEEAYGRYQAVENQIFADGGRESEKIEEVAIGDALEAARKGISTFSENNYRQVGDVAFRTIQLQHFDPASLNGEAIVSLYICLDFTSQDVLDEQNQSVVNPDRPLMQAFEVAFDNSSLGLLLSSREPWTDNKSCMP